MAPMDPPPPAQFSSLEELINSTNAFAQSHGYKLVVVRSKTNAQGSKTWVHLACDRHGTKRNTHNLTEETRKKNRRSRRCECPMYVVANKTPAQMWEMSIRHGEHNHGPYEPPPKKKKDIPPPPPSELVNLPLLQTPSSCYVDFCLVPVGTGSPSVSHEIAEVQRLLKRSGLQYTMHAAGTTVEGNWDEVMKIIGQAHSVLHASGVVRIQTTMRVGTRTDKKQTAEEKINAVRAILDGEDDGVGEQSMVDTVPDSTPQHTPQQRTPQQHAQQHAHQGMAQRMNPANIAPDLDRVMPPGPQVTHQHHPNPNHPMAQAMNHIKYYTPPGHQMQQHMNHQMGQSHHMNQNMGPMS